jgi:hypothetical protein
MPTPNSTAMLGRAHLQLVKCSLTWMILRDGAWPEPACNSNVGTAEKQEMPGTRRCILIHASAPNSRAAWPLVLLFCDVSKQEAFRYCHSEMLRLREGTQREGGGLIGQRMKAGRALTAGQAGRAGADRQAAAR